MWYWTSLQNQLYFNLLQVNMKKIYIIHKMSFRYTMILDRGMFVQIQQQLSWISDICYVGMQRCFHGVWSCCLSVDVIIVCMGGGLGWRLGRGCYVVSVTLQGGILLDGPIMVQPPACPLFQPGLTDNRKPNVYLGTCRYVVLRHQAVLWRPQLLCQRSQPPRQWHYLLCENPGRVHKATTASAHDMCSLKFW